MSETILIEIRDLLSQMLAEMKKQSSQMEVNTDSTPWVFKLVLEMNTGIDQDNNGLIFGKNFSLAENFNHVPPSLQPSLATLQRDRWPGKMITWEEYRDTLPNGPHKDQVTSFINSLPVRNAVESTKVPNGQKV